MKISVLVTEEVLMPYDDASGTSALSCQSDIKHHGHDQVDVSLEIGCSLNAFCL